MAALLLSACGGPSDASVIARADAICSQAVAALRSQPGTRAGLSAAARVVAKEVRGLRGLPRPAEHLRVLERFLAAEQTVAHAYAELAVTVEHDHRSAVARAESALALAAEEAATSARRYGLSRCAAAGPTVGSG